jgi:transcriptional regulator with XRE-family HTH domain
MLGETLKQLRVDHGFLLKDVAGILGVDIAYISRIEKGEKQISKKQLARLARHYGVEVNTLNRLWLADRIINLVEGEKQAKESLEIANKYYRART